MPAEAASNWFLSGFGSIARSVWHFLDVLDELNHLNIEFVSFRRISIPAARSAGHHHHRCYRGVERNLIIERVRAGMRRARLEGQHINRRPLDIDRAAVLRDRTRGQSRSEIETTFRISRATVSP
jgi:Resolvase, N terminal domain